MSSFPCSRDITEYEKTWLFIAYSNKRSSHYQFSLPNLYAFSLQCWENVLFDLRSERVNAFAEPIIFLIKSLEKALAASTRRYLGFSPLELTEGLGHIASNDMNKKLVRLALEFIGGQRSLPWGLTSACQHRFR